MQAINGYCVHCWIPKRQISLYFLLSICQQRATGGGVCSLATGACLQQTLLAAIPVRKESTRWQSFQCCLHFNTAAPQNAAIARSFISTLLFDGIQKA